MQTVHVINKNYDEVCINYAICDLWFDGLAPVSFCGEKLRESFICDTITYEYAGDNGPISSSRRVKSET